MKKLTLILSLMIALIGLNANAAMYIIGQNPFGDWDPSKGVEMELQNDGSYRIDATFVVADVWFIFAETTGTWNEVNAVRYDCGNTSNDLEVFAGVEFTPVKGNSGKSFKFSGTIGEKYTITFNPNTMKAMVSGYVEPVTDNYWSVAGEPASIFGDPAWNTTKPENDMTLGENGLYTLVKENVEISAGTTVGFKVVHNHGWGTSYPAENYTHTFNEAGTYNLTFTFNEATTEVGFTFEKVSDGPEINPLTGDLFMLGQVNGNGWAANVGVEMATTDENVFTLTDAVIADSGDGFGYFSFASKLGESADDWGFTAYRRGAIEDGYLLESGVTAVLDEWGTANAFKAAPGTYDVAVNLSENTVVLTLKEAPQPQIDDVYIIGDVNNIGWTPSNGVQMTYDEVNEVYTAEITTQNQGDLGIGYFGFTKKLADPESETAWNDIIPFRFGPVSEGPFVMIEDLLGVDCALATDGSFNSIGIPEGTWTVTVDLVNHTFVINGTWPVDTVVPEPVDNVYIIGDVNNIGWSATNGVQMTYDEENEVYTAEITTQNQGDLGIGYFGFTKKLADPESETAWDDIAAFRFGPVSEGPFVMIEDLLGVDCALATDGSFNSIGIPEGTWTVTVDLVNHTFVINGTWPVDTVVPEPYTGDVYVLGEVNDNGGWYPNVGVKMNRDEENNIYTLTITTTGEAFVDSVTNIGYSYFSFTKQLAEAADAWDEIAPYRFGAVSEGDFLVNDETLGIEIALENNGDAFMIPAGTWNLTLSVDDMTLVITQGSAWEIGDVNHDHNIDVSDVTTLIAYVLGNNPENFFLSEANVNDADNNIDVGDVTALIAKVLSN